jgi:hypothetical protein
MLHLVEESHRKMCPRVPFVGWDVVLSADPKLPVCLLEVNLSCNFFCGSFDKKVRAAALHLWLWNVSIDASTHSAFCSTNAFPQVYLDFIDDALAELQEKRLEADKQRKIFRVK